MNRTLDIIKYLEEYQHHCYIRRARAKNKAEEEHYNNRYKDIGKLITELCEDSCRRTIDGDTIE